MNAVVELLRPIGSLKSGARMLAYRREKGWAVLCNGREIPVDAVDAVEILAEGKGQRSAEDLYGAARLDQYALAPNKP